MLFEKIGTGSSIAEAYENAKLLLEPPEDAQLHQEIIQDAKRKFLGLKIEPAKVKVWYETPDKKEAAPSAAPAGVPKKPAEKRNAAAKQGAPAKREARSAKKPGTPRNEATAQPTENDNKKKIQAAPAELVPEDISDDDTAANYLKLIAEGMQLTDVNLSLAKNPENDEYIYTIKCQEEGMLIGKRGETLDAIQYLLRLAMSKGKGEDKHRRVSVNVGSYREKRCDNLKTLAIRNAKQVLKYGKSVTLNPMNPYERRIIHTTVQGIEGVTSHSTGEDTGRRVVISLEEGVQPTHPSRGGYNNNSRDRRGRRPAGRAPYQKKEPYVPEQTRQPRKDSAGSLYGKIEIPTKADNQ